MRQSTSSPTGNKSNPNKQIQQLFVVSYLRRSAEVARERDAKLGILQSFSDHSSLFQSNRVQGRVSLALNYPVPILLCLAVTHNIHSYDRFRSSSAASPIEFPRPESVKRSSHDQHKEQGDGSNLGFPLESATIPRHPRSLFIIAVNFTAPTFGSE